MKIAVASQNGRTISGHIGKVKGFTLFTIDGAKIITSERIKLEKDQTFHSLDLRLPTALQDIDVLITGGHGSSLVEKLKTIGLKNFITTEKVPEIAVTLFLEGKLPVITSEEFHELGGGHHDHHH